MVALESDEHRCGSPQNSSTEKPFSHPFLAAASFYAGADYSTRHITVKPTVCIQHLTFSMSILSLVDWQLIGKQSTKIQA